jgi:hypothetical protein
MDCVDASAVSYRDCKCSVACFRGGDQSGIYVTLQRSTLQQCCKCNLHRYAGHYMDMPFMSVLCVYSKCAALETVNCNTMTLAAQAEPVPKQGRFFERILSRKPLSTELPLHAQIICSVGNAKHASRLHFT